MDIVPQFKNFSPLPDASCAMLKAPSYSGYVYVIEYSDGTVKVGTTTNPANRVRAHIGDAHKFGLKVKRGWISVCHKTPTGNEAKLIRHAEGQASDIRRREYFEGIDVLALMKFADGLDYTEYTVEERAKLIAEADARMKDLSSQLFGRPDEGPFEDPHSLLEFYRQRLRPLFESILGKSDPLAEFGTGVEGLEGTDLSDVFEIVEKEGFKPNNAGVAASLLTGQIRMLYLNSILDAREASK